MLQHSNDAVRRAISTIALSSIHIRNTTLRIPAVYIRFWTLHSCGSSDDAVFHRPFMPKHHFHFTPEHAPVGWEQTEEELPNEAPLA